MAKRGKTRKAYDYYDEVVQQIQQVSAEMQMSETEFVNYVIERALMPDMRERFVNDWDKFRKRGLALLFDTGEQFNYNAPVFDLSKKAKKKKQPTLDEVEKYFKDNGYAKEAAETFYKYYYEASNGTDQQGKDVVNWKQKAVVVWFPRLPKIKSDSENNNKQYNEID